MMRVNTIRELGSRRLVRTVALVALVASAACLNNDVTGTRPLTTTITSSSPTVTLGDSIGFEFGATGTGIVLFVLDYGDASADTITFSGPIEIGGLLWHTYLAAGAYTVVGRTTSVSGSVSDSVAVTVN
jgi:hypothetical protein